MGSIIFGDKMVEAQQQAAEVIDAFLSPSFCAIWNKATVQIVVSKKKPKEKLVTLCGRMNVPPLLFFC